MPALSSSCDIEEPSDSTGQSSSLALQEMKKAGQVSTGSEYIPRSA